MHLKATLRADGYARIPRGFRELKKGERVRESDRFLKDNKGPWVTLRSQEMCGGTYDPHTKQRPWGDHTHIRRRTPKPIYSAPAPKHAEDFPEY